MRSFRIHCLFGIIALMLSFNCASLADDASTARSKSNVREFYTTVLINGLIRPHSNPLPF